MIRYEVDLSYRVTVTFQPLVRRVSRAAVGGRVHDRRRINIIIFF
jgi:hypothetical protein